MFSKPFPGDRISSFLALIFLIPGVWLQFFPPQHPLHPDFSSVFMIAGLTFLQFGNFLFVPLLLLTASAIIHLIPQINHQVSHTVTLVTIALAVAFGFWRWWRDRQVKIIQKKLN